MRMDFYVDNIECVWKRIFFKKNDVMWMGMVVVIFFLENGEYEYGWNGGYCK